MRLRKNKPTSHRKATQSRLTVFSRLFRRTPKDVATDMPALSWQPPQQPDEMPPATTRCAGPLQSPELDEAARRVTETFSGHFQLDPEARVFRADDTTFEQFEKSRQADLARGLDLNEPWSAAGGVNLGLQHGPKTLVLSLTEHGRFSDGTGTIPAVKR